MTFANVPFKKSMREITFANHVNDFLRDVTLESEVSVDHSIASKRVKLSEMSTTTENRQFENQ